LGHFFVFACRGAVQYLEAPGFKINTNSRCFGAVFGCLAAFGYLFPNNLIYVYFLLPIKAKWFVLIYAGLEFGWEYATLLVIMLRILLTLGGALAGFILVLFGTKPTVGGFINVAD
jgi:membrane associated rhomboid family serine protease